MMLRCVISALNMPDNLVVGSVSCRIAGVELPRMCCPRLTGTLNPLSSYTYTSGSGPDSTLYVTLRATLVLLHSASDDVTDSAELNKLVTYSL